MDSIIGIKSDDWWHLLKANRFDVDIPYWPKALVITMMSIRNSMLNKKETKIFGDKIDQTEIKKPPVFLLGHWRSGTTHLHNLLSVDSRFSYPNVFQIYNPHTFLYKRGKMEERIKRMEAQNRPMDNVKITLESPAEEEFAVGIMSLFSPLLGWLFPCNEAHYDKYLSFKNVSKEEIALWKDRFLYFLKKVTLQDDRQLLLKSPVNTARIGLLLEMFPEAKFINIVRNPYHVFKSTRKLYQKAVFSSNLQRRKSNGLDNYILQRYNDMYDAFFKDKKLIPHGQYFEIRFEELEKDPVAVIKSIYDHFQFEGYAEYETELQTYLESVRGYKKNHYEELGEPLKKTIAEKWHQNFESWGYPA